MIYHGGCTIDCGDHGHHNIEMLKLIPAGTKLYTTPPAERRPLTQDEIEKCFPVDGYLNEAGRVIITAQWLREFARAIEAAHGIKEQK